MSTVPWRPRKLVSGGQTGVDRAGLDIAADLRITSGGWCPRGRRAENGRIPSRYPVRETPGAEYRWRTAWNIRDSDATLLLTRDQPVGGSALTVHLARVQRKPLLPIRLGLAPSPFVIRAWLQTRRIGILNIAGPRESECPGIYQQAYAYLRRIFAD